jgi:GT2 family glycosyltransferase
LITKIKRSLKKLVAKDAMVNIDFVISQGAALVLSGWAARKTLAINKNSVLVTQNDKSLDASVFTFNRNDVTAKLQLSDNANCTGFVIIIDDFAGHLDSLRIEHSNTSFPFSKLRYRQAANLAEILSNVPEKHEQAKLFIESHGLKLDKGNVGKAIIRHLDKDVEKIKEILQAVDVYKTDFAERLAKEALPEIQKIWRAKQAKNNERDVKLFGHINEAPIVSIIIPLYGRYDFMQHQLANFSADITMQAAEVIFVLDDPTLSREVLITAHGLFETFKFPFKLVLSERNRGFAGANNLGSEFATSELLLLLNSDILPVEPAWLPAYLQQFNELENCGILGATLVYEDNTIQHAGMEFRQDSHYPGIWMNHHPYKGLPLDLVELKDAFQTASTTGACMLMSTSLYKELDGFDTMYVLGDFEDSDLCLKVTHKQLDIYVSGKVHFYHLERLSQDLVDGGDWKFKLTLANGVYQASKWRLLIEDLSA